MEHSWDIVVWTQENTIDYVPSSWANTNETKYKYPRSKNSLRIRNLIDNNMLLEDEFEWLEAICKAQSVKDLQIAKELCEKGTYTSNIEISDQECEGEKKKKRKRTIKRPFNGTDSSSDEDIPLARGQNLIRKAFSIPSLKSQQTSSVQSNPQKRNECFSEPVLETIKENASKYEIQFPSGSTLNNSFTQQISEATLVSSRHASSSVSKDFSSVDLTKLLEELTEIKFFMKESKAVLSRIELLMTSKSNTNFGDDTISENSNSFLEKLPCQNKEQLEEIECIINELKYMKELITFLYLAGGNSPHKSAYMAMQKFFGKELALLYSAQGKKKKIPFCCMKVYQAVFEAVRKRHPTVTDESIKKSVSLFLATAKSRLTGKSLPAAANEEEVDLLDTKDKEGARFVR